MIEAIVYTSNAGYTREYAKLLSEKTGLPVHSLEEAKGSVKEGTEILYLGWIMASEIKGYKKAAKRYRIDAVCGVGMGPTGGQMAEVQKRNGIGSDPVLFTLQGGFDITRLTGMYKFMMNTMKRTAGKALAEKTDRTPEEDAMLEMMEHGGDCVSEENLEAVLEWYRSQQ